MSEPWPDALADEPEADWAGEARRQAALVAMLRSPTLPVALPAGWRPLVPGDEAAREGLAAYWRNGRASARRAVSQAYPVLQRCLGEQALGVLAHRLWEQSPPGCGDLNRWGDALPALLDHAPEVSPWPWLGDLARLEWALHLARQAADPVPLDAAMALGPLADGDPASLWLQLRPGLSLLTTSWRVQHLWRLHQDDGGDTELADGLAAWQAGLSAPTDSTCEHLLVLRRGAAAPDIFSLTVAEHAFTSRIGLGLSLDQALRACPSSFDLAAWLLRAWSGGWLIGVRTTSPEISSAMETRA